MISRLENLKWLYNHVHPRPEKLVALPQRVSLVALLLLRQLRNQALNQHQSQHLLRAQLQKLRHARLQQVNRRLGNHQSLNHLQMFVTQIVTKLYQLENKSVLPTAQNFAQRVFRRRQLRSQKRSKALQRATHVKLHQSESLKRAESQRAVPQNL